MTWRSRNHDSRILPLCPTLFCLSASVVVSAVLA